MPYIKSNDGRREALQKGDIALNAGELNYQIFKYVKDCGGKSINFIQIRTYIDNFLGERPNYQRYNDMTGCLVRCYKEIKRRLGYNISYLLEMKDSYDDEIANYEDKKIVENGDVE